MLYLEKIGPPFRFSCVLFQAEERQGRSHVIVSVSRKCLVYICPGAYLFVHMYMWSMCASSVCICFYGIKFREHGCLCSFQLQLSCNSRLNHDVACTISICLFLIKYYLHIPVREVQCGTMCDFPLKVSFHALFTMKLWRHSEWFLFAVHGSALRKLMMMVWAVQAYHVMDRAYFDCREGEVGIHAVRWVTSKFSYDGNVLAARGTEKCQKLHDTNSDCVQYVV